MKQPFLFIHIDQTPVKGARWWVVTGNIVLSNEKIAFFEWLKLNEIHPVMKNETIEEKIQLQSTVVDGRNTISW